MKEYYYLVASLPSLWFGTKMPISYKDFFSLCVEQLSRRDLEIIRRVSISPQENPEDPVLTLREWKKFDIALRNELARARAIGKGKEPLRYIRGEYSYDITLAILAKRLVSENLPVEAERLMDSIRWKKADQLGRGHYFDIDYLIIYAIKLQILERWNNIAASEGKKALQGVLEEGLV